MIQAEIKENRSKRQAKSDARKREAAAKASSATTTLFPYGVPDEI